MWHALFTRDFFPSLISNQWNKHYKYSKKRRFLYENINVIYSVFVLYGMAQRIDVEIKLLSVIGFRYWDGSAIREQIPHARTFK